MKAKTMLLNVIMLSGLMMLNSCKSSSKCELALADGSVKSSSKCGPALTDGSVKSSSKYELASAVVESSYKKPTNYYDSFKPTKVESSYKKPTNYYDSFKPTKVESSYKKPTNYYDSFKQTKHVLTYPYNHDPIKKPTKQDQDVLGQSGDVPLAPSLSKKNQDIADRVPPPGPPPDYQR
ncbi:hypothetical protein AGMMS50222_05180 [Endomicrobiia bacterium]|nr:hypothetical protein AGMMS49556_09490 [Endomicrobiia bacterium]GHT75013.1 hypothetical protein AGMMS50222_05180 [Endomicrobiia bacterium]